MGTHRFGSLLQVAILACVLLVAMFWGLGAMQASYAQGPITLTKVLNRATDVVRVGELLSFTISLTNNSAFTLTNVTLVDSYDQAVLAFAWASPSHDVHDPAAGTITWTNVAASPIPPGYVLTFTVYFTAEHPKTTVVNHVRAQDLVLSSGAITQSAETSRTQETIGGAAPVFKSVSPPDSIPVTGLPITFTHLITNDGAAIMTVLPLTDTYDPAFLEFHYAVPTPTLVITGTLVWTDLTDYVGDLAPFQTVIVTTVFTATTEVITTVNRASTEGALDVYDNDLTAGATQVPITIIDNTPTSTPTTAPQPTNTPVPVRPTNTPVHVQPTFTSVPVTRTPGLSPTVTSAAGGALLPETGHGMTGGAMGPGIAVLACVAVGAILLLVRRRG